LRSHHCLHCAEEDGAHKGRKRNQLCHSESAAKTKIEAARRGEVTRLENGRAALFHSQVRGHDKIFEKWSAPQHASVNRQACTHRTATTTRNTAIERLLRKGQLASSNHSYNPKVRVGGTTSSGRSSGELTQHWDLSPMTRDEFSYQKNKTTTFIHSKYSQPRS
jgi:hypothetical protein